MHRKRRTSKTGDGIQLDLPNLDQVITLPDFGEAIKIIIDDLDRPIALPDLTLPEINIPLDQLPDLDQVIDLPALDLSSAIVAPLPRPRGSRRHA